MDGQRVGQKRTARATLDGVAIGFIGATASAHALVLAFCGDGGGDGACRRPADMTIEVLADG